MYLLQCLTASDASFISTSPALQAQSLGTPFRDSPRAAVKLVSGGSTPATSASTQNFTVTAPEPAEGVVVSATYDLVMVNSHPPASGAHLVVDMQGAGGDVIPHQDMGEADLGQASAQTSKVGCGRILFGMN